MDFKLPELGEGVYEAELVKWLVQPGDSVQRGQSLMEVLTDKATFEVPSNFSGAIADLRAEPGEAIKVGQTVMTYSAEGAPKPRRQTAVEQPLPNSGVKQPASQASKSSGPRQAGPIKAAPSVRLLARKLGLDLGQVRGSGPDGRILLDDLTPVAAQPDGVAATGREARPDYGTPGSPIKLVGIRKKIAEHMVLAKRTIPHYSYVDECDITELVQLRDSLKQSLAQQGVHLTYLAFFVCAVARALKAVPIVNATLDEEAGEIVLHAHYHIGIAVSTPAGLIVPVVHDADRKNLVEIAREIDQLSGAARAGKIKLDDLKGGVFTITSVGNIGGLISTPVINHPQVGILGVGKVVRRPVYDEHGQIRPADLIYLSFSFDHRVVDGAIGAAFGNAVSEQLHRPAQLLLD